MSALFAFKLTLVPFFILALSLAGRRWGTAVSGWLVALPVVAGPIVFFIGMEQGEAFAAGAARATIAGLASLAVYSLVYSRVALRAGWAPSLLAGWAGFFLSTYLLNRLPLTLPQSIALALSSLVGVYLLLPPVDPEASPPETPSWEIAARMAAAVGMVLLMTSLARPLGPHLALPLYCAAYAWEERSVFWRYTAPILAAYAIGVPAWLGGGVELLPHALAGLVAWGLGRLLPGGGGSGEEPEADDASPASSTLGLRD